VLRHGDMMLAFPGDASQPDMTSGLSGRLVAKLAQALDKLFSTYFPRDSHAAMTSSLTI